MICRKEGGRESAAKFRNFNRVPSSSVEIDSEGLVKPSWTHLHQGSEMKNKNSVEALFGTLSRLAHSERLVDLNLSPGGRGSQVRDLLRHLVEGGAASRKGPLDAVQSTTPARMT